MRLFVRALVAAGLTAVSVSAGHRGPCLGPGRRVGAAFSAATSACYANPSWNSCYNTDPQSTGCSAEAYDATVGTVHWADPENGSCGAAMGEVILKNAALVLVSAAVGTSAVFAASAQAVEEIVLGMVAAGSGLEVHSGSPTSAVIDTVRYVSAARLSCWISGPSVTGPWGATSVWDAVEGCTTPSGQRVDFVGGTRVFSSDVWINTGGDTSEMLPHG